VAQEATQCLGAVCRGHERQGASGDACHRIRCLRGNRGAIDSLLLPNREASIMGRGILLWLLGVPIPIIILLALIWR